MTVLYIIGVLAIVIVLLMFVGWVNALSQSKYDYEFFTYGNLALTTIAYALLFFGAKFYLDALSAHGDILNGILMMGIGAIIILGVLIWHIKHTSFIFGLLFGILQLVIYIPAGIVSFLIIIAALAWLSDTKPVYRL